MQIREGAAHRGTILVNAATFVLQKGTWETLCLCHSLFLSLLQPPRSEFLTADLESLREPFNVGFSELYLENLAAIGALRTVDLPADVFIQLVNDSVYRLPRHRGVLEESSKIPVFAIILFR